MVNMVFSECTIEQKVLPFQLQTEDIGRFFNRELFVGGDFSTAVFALVGILLIQSLFTEIIFQSIIYRACLPDVQ